MPHIVVKIITDGKMRCSFPNYCVRKKSEQYHIFSEVTIFIIAFVVYIVITELNNLIESGIKFIVTAFIIVIGILD